MKASPPRRAPYGYAIPGCGGWQRCPQHSGGAPRRRVLATDHVSRHAGIARGSRARQEGLHIETPSHGWPSARTRDGSKFDMAGSQFGVMLFPDMPKGISEMARVVSPAAVC